MKEITITVAGQTATGKSTVAQLVRNALRMTGINAVLAPGEEEFAAPSLIDRTDALEDSGTKVIIRTVNAQKRQGNA